MKINLWLLCGMMVSTAVLAQQASSSPGTGPIETPAPAPAATAPAAPGTETPPALGAAPSTNAPAAKTAKKKGGKKKGGKKSGNKGAPRRAAVPRPELKSVPLVAGPAVVVATHVNVRAQAKLHSEVVGHLTKGQQVTVLEEITLNNSAPDEPSAWAKITIPPGTHAWVNSTYLDPANKTVKATRLNLRAGPGENYSILGRLDHGQAVKDITTKGDWTEIEPPASAFAFVAAQFLKQEEAAPAPSPGITGVPTPAAGSPPGFFPAGTITPPPAVAQTPATPPATVTPPPIETPAPAPTAPAAPEVAAPTAPAPAPAPETNVQEPPPPRIISHEGIVRGMTSIQAPSHFELVSPENGKTIDYLYTNSKELDLRRYKGLRIIVTGEEGLDERWGHTPVLTIQRIEVLSEPPAFNEPGAFSELPPPSPPGPPR
jgi:uncharacterized protein YgiM (DUF1202 family)